jgi:hypothetical protein
MKFYVTGNEYVSLPEIRETDAAVLGLSFLHMGAKGMIEMRGGKDKPLLKPFLRVNGEELELRDFDWRRTYGWIPTFTAKSGQLTLTGVILAPIDERGFGVKLSIENASDAVDVSFGLAGCWGETLHSINESKRVRGEVNLYESGWNHTKVMDMRTGLSLFAFAPIYTERPETCPVESSYCRVDDQIDFEIFLPVRLGTRERREFCVWFGLGYEEVAAATSAKEMLRRGFDAELKKTTDWLRKRERTVGDAALDELFNLNLDFCFFFGGGKTIDTEEFVLMTSRSPRYYVSAAYWDRDSLLWSFPAVLLTDPETAREMLAYVFTKQIKNVGIHSRFIDGTVLEPGFELDELMAPIIALWRYGEATGDRSFSEKPYVKDGIAHILKRLATVYNSTLGLYETFLQPTDDLRVYPYLTYDNVLVWFALLRLAKIYPAYSYLLDEAQKLKESILSRCIRELDGEKMFAWSIDADGNWDVYDEPPGSLLLLPHYGFCTENDPVWLHTKRIIRREEYPYSFAGCPIAEIGCPHAPHPWVLSIANSLLSGDAERARQNLLKCEMDNGVACESVDEYTGQSATGNAFATCAGFLAYAIDTAFSGKRKEKEGVV